MPFFIFPGYPTRAQYETKSASVILARICYDISWQLRLGNLRLGSLTWVLPFGSFGQGSSAWELLYEHSRLGNIAWDRLLGIFRSRTLAWDPSLGKICFEVVFRIFRLHELSFRGSRMGIFASKAFALDSSLESSCLETLAFEALACDIGLGIFHL